MILVEEKSPNTFVTVTDVNRVVVSQDGEKQAPVRSLLDWSSADLQEFKLYRVEAAQVPEGHYVTEERFFRDGMGKIVHAVTTEEIPFVPTMNDVIVERTRRLSAGFDYDFADERGVHRIGTKPSDHLGWGKVTDLAGAAINVGAPTTAIFITTDTGPVEITAMEWQQILIAAAQFEQPIYQASFVLQAADPIPADYKDDSHWPQ